MKTDPRSPSQCYSGLAADLYEPLLGEVARADDYAPFLERCGTPALELACGSGLPMLDLLERGHDVEGLDASSEAMGATHRFGFATNGSRPGVSPRSSSAAGRGAGGRSLNSAISWRPSASKPRTSSRPRVGPRPRTPTSSWCC